MSESDALSQLPVVDSAGDKNDDREVMIKVDHVTMEFNIASERLTSLKEYAIKLAKGGLFFEGFKALDDVSFEVRKGDVFGIMGTNGSGKSTILKIIAGVLEPTSGKCCVKGQIAPLIELGAGFDMELTARENIYLNGALLGYTKEFIDENFDAIVSFAEIESFLDMPMKNYSSGMVSRIAFAVATVMVPDVLIVDEVLSVGDFMFQKKCEERIAELIHEYGVTVLIVSHSNEQVSRLCNRAVWLEKGIIRLEGDAASVAQVYKGLGGRSGTPESEKRMYSLLTGISNDANPEYLEALDERISELTCESSEEAGAQFIRLCEDELDTEAIVLVNNLTHGNAVVGTPLAGALNASVLPIRAESFSGATSDFLYEHKPRELFIVDCGGSSKRMFTKAAELPWHPHVTVFCTDGDWWKLSLEVFRYGIERGIWGSTIACLDFVDNVVSMAMLPVLYKESSPVLMSERGGRIVENELVESLEQAGAAEMLIAGMNAQMAFAFLEKSSDARLRNLTKERDCDTCLAIAERQLKEADEGLRRDVIVSNMAESQWNKLLSIGPYACHKCLAFVRIDTLDLDNLCAALDVFDCYGAHIKNIVSLGDRVGLTADEARCLATTLVR